MNARWEKKNVTKHSPYASALIFNTKFIEVGCGAICRRRRWEETNEEENRRREECREETLCNCELWYAAMIINNMKRIEMAHKIIINWLLCTDDLYKLTSWSNSHGFKRRDRYWTFIYTLFFCLFFSCACLCERFQTHRAQPTTLWWSLWFWFQFSICLLFEFEGAEALSDTKEAHKQNHTDL